MAISHQPSSLPSPPLLPVHCPGCCGAEIAEVVGKGEHEILLQNFVSDILYVFGCNVSVDASVLFQQVKNPKFDLTLAVLEDLFTRAHIPQEIALVKAFRQSFIILVVEVILEEPACFGKKVQVYTGIVLEIILFQCHDLVAGLAEIGRIGNGKVHILTHIATNHCSSRNRRILCFIEQVIAVSRDVGKCDSSVEVKIRLDEFYRNGKGEERTQAAVAVQVDGFRQ